MASYTNFLIGIQARTTSERLPGKVLSEIGGVPMIQHVIRACESSARYINNFTSSTRTIVRVAVLVPTGDKKLRPRSKEERMLFMAQRTTFFRDM